MSNAFELPDSNAHTPEGSFAIQARAVHAICTALLRYGR